MIGRKLARQVPGRPIEARTLNRNAETTEAHAKTAISGLGRRMAGGIPQFVLSHICYATFAKSRSGGIPAMTGVKPGKAVVDFYSFNGLALLEGAPGEAFNIASSDVGGLKWLVILVVMGYPFVLFEDCVDGD